MIYDTEFSGTGRSQTPMAAERYRWVPWQKERKTDPKGNYGYMWDEEYERLVSPAELIAALNAVEDARRAERAAPTPETQ